MNDLKYPLIDTSFADKPKLSGLVWWLIIKLNLLQVLLPTDFDFVNQVKDYYLNKKIRNI